MTINPHSSDDLANAERHLAYAVAGRRLSLILGEHDVDRYAPIVVIADGRYLGIIDLELVQAVDLADLVGEATGALALGAATTGAVS